MKFNYYQDPGHGWVKVPKKLLKKLGIADKISGFSYMRGDFAYLEEDNDCSLFCNTMKEKGIPFEFKENHTNKTSKIREYDSYMNYTPEEEQEIKEIQNKMTPYKNWNKKALNNIKNASLGTLRYWQEHYNNFA